MEIGIIEKSVKADGNYTPFIQIGKILIAKETYKV